MSGNFHADMTIFFRGAFGPVSDSLIIVKFSDIECKILTLMQKYTLSITFSMSASSYLGIVTVHKLNKNALRCSETEIFDLRPYKTRKWHRIWNLFREGPFEDCSSKNFKLQSRMRDSTRTGHSLGHNAQHVCGDLRNWRVAREINVLHVHSISQESARIHRFSVWQI